MIQASIADAQSSGRANNRVLKICDSKMVKGEAPQPGLHPKHAFMPAAGIAADAQQ